MARHRYCRRLLRYRNNLRVSADLVAKPAAHTRAESRGSRPSKADAGERRTLCWREPDSNHRFRLRYSPSGSSLVVSADLSTLPSRKRSSQRTQRWRETDSNHRSPARKSRFLLRKANCGTERGQPKRVVSYAVPMVRIHLPPAASPLRTHLDSLRTGTAGPERRDGKSTDELCARATSTSPSPSPLPLPRKRVGCRRRGQAGAFGQQIGGRDRDRAAAIRGALQRRGALPPESLGPPGSPPPPAEAGAACGRSPLRSPAPARDASARHRPARARRIPA